MVKAFTLGSTGRSTRATSFKAPKMVMASGEVSRVTFTKAIGAITSAGGSARMNGSMVIDTKESTCKASNLGKASINSRTEIFTLVCICRANLMGTESTNGRNLDLFS